MSGQFNDYYFNSHARKREAEKDDKELVTMNNLMNFQKFCCDKWFGPRDEGDKFLAIPALGVAGEAGEVADKIKKLLRGDNVEAKEIVKEIGDVLFYCAVLCDRLGYNLDEAAQMEVDKINDRIARGTQRGDGDNR